ncbi:MAG: AmmeMemoRadiSam system protein B [Patescibacteria group bacterium]|nr:AmmeMemoRadiSam system protein B [Patescibacteria group bacterium]
MLVFSAIVPHPPILIPAIGKENLEVIKKTKFAMEELAEHLYAAKPEVIIVVSPHGELHEGKITINQAPKFVGAFNKFGDLTTKMEWQGELGLSYKIYEKMETEGTARLIHDENLDHGAAVPLFYLAQNLPEVKILPINYCLRDLKFHFDFGKELGEIIHAENRRVAFIASGDLSHRLTKDAPAGYNPNGKKFDKLLLALLKEKKYEEILNMDVDLVEDAGECGLRSIAVLLGIIKDMNITPQLLSYEGPFGVGYAVMEIV